MNINSADYTLEQSKFLGGDLESTHLVRGLDFNLLRKTRGDAPESLSLGSLSSSSSSSSFQQDVYLPDVSQSASRGVGGARLGGGNSRSFLPSAMHTGAAAKALPPGMTQPSLKDRSASKAASAAPIKAGPATQVVLSIGEKIQLRLSHRQGQEQGQVQGHGQRKSWIDGIKEMSIHPETCKVGPVATPVSSGVTRHGIALARLRYDFDTRLNAPSDLPTQTISSQLTSKSQQQFTKKGLTALHSALEVSLLRKIKAALSPAAAGVDAGISSKKRKRKDKESPVAVRAIVPAAAPPTMAYAADDSDDDIFAGAGDYVPVGAITDTPERANGTAGSGSGGEA